MNDIFLKEQMQRLRSKKLKRIVLLNPEEFFSKTSDFQEIYNERDEKFEAIFVFCFFVGMEKEIPKRLFLEKIDGFEKTNRFDGIGFF